MGAEVFDGEDAVVPAKNGKLEAVGFNRMSETLGCQL